MDANSESKDDVEAASMATLMGFSSFGSQVPAAVKRRKFTAGTDAFVDGQELEKLDRGGKKGKGSGGNEVPLGKRRDLGQGVGEEKPRGEVKGAGGLTWGVRNEEEINLGGREVEEVLRSPNSGSCDSDDEEGPHYIDTSVPSISSCTPGNLDTDIRGAQDKIYSMLAAKPGHPPRVPSSMPPPPLPPGLGASIQYGLPQRPAGVPTVTAGEHENHNVSMANSWRHRRREGERNERWYEGYYDSSFNENPWAELEKAIGLESMGSWVDKGVKKA